MQKEFTSEEICSIIKQCGNSGVSSFNFSGLRVTFRNPKLTDSVPQEMFTTPEMQEAVLSEVIEKDEFALKSAILAQMEIEDPVEYERLMTTGDLIDSKDGENQDDEDIGAEQALY